MIKIKFLDAQEVKDGEGIVIESWRAGQVVELNNGSARFWLSRGLALDVQAAARESREAKEAEKKVASVAVVDVKEPEVERVEAAEEKATPSTGKTNPTSHGSGRAKRSPASHRGQA